MLNIFRQRQSLVKIVLGFILFLVCVTMVITLIPGMTGDTGDSVNNPVVAEVAGNRITTYDLQQSIQQISQRNRVPSEMMPFYTTQILNEMILEKASLAEAERLGLRVDASELLNQLRQDPNIYPNGGFIGQDQYEDLVSERFGMNVAQFEERYREAVLLDKLRQFVTDSITVTPEEVHQAFVTENEKFVFDYVFFNPADFKKDVGNPTDSTLEDYFKKNKERYQIPEKRTAKILLVRDDKIRETTPPVSEADIKKYYQDHLDLYRIPERVMVRHILLKADQKDLAKVAEAKKKAEDLEKKLKAGADFLTLAKQFSEDTASAPTGGLMNWIGRKETVPEFENAAFSLAPNQVSDPVQTVYGFHIIKLVSHEQPHVQSLDELKNAIATLLADPKIKAAAADAADKAAEALKRSPADIAAVAEKYHGEVLEPAPFQQNDSLPQIGSSAPFMQGVFGLEKGKAGSAIQVTPGYAIPVLLDVSAAHQGEFAEVKERVKNDYIEEQAKTKASDKAKELAKALEQQDKKDLKKAAQSLKLTVKTTAPMTREGTAPGLGNMRDLDPKTFSLPVGGTAGPTSITGGEAIYQVMSHEPPKEEDFAGKKAAIQDQLLNQKRQVAFEIYQDSLRNRLIASGRLKIHQDALAQITSTEAPRP